MKKALGYLDRYLFLLAFTSYLDEQSKLSIEISFTEWLRGRPEVFNILRTTRTFPTIASFRPIHDLAGFLDETGRRESWDSELDLNSNEIEQLAIKVDKIYS